MTTAADHRLVEYRAFVLTRVGPHGNIAATSHPGLLFPSAPDTERASIRSRRLAVDRVVGAMRLEGINPKSHRRRNVTFFRGTDGLLVAVVRAKRPASSAQEPDEVFLRTLRTVGVSHHRPAGISREAARFLRRIQRPSPAGTPAMTSPRVAESNNHAR